MEDFPTKIFDYQNTVQSNEQYPTFSKLLKLYHEDVSHHNDSIDMNNLPAENKVDKISLATFITHLKELGWN